MGWLLILTACDTPGQGTAEARVRGTSCVEIAAEWDTGDVACDGAGVVFGAELVDPEGTPLPAEVPFEQVIAVAAVVANPTEADIVLESPDCVVKDVTVHAPNGLSVGAHADCFEPTTWTIAAGATEREVHGMGGFSGEEGGAGHVAFTVRYLYRAGEDVRYCTVCADGVEIVP
ncbi:MAG: hypothetical protein ACOZNI_24385 [Myxococcota bacterium]